MNRAVPLSQFMPYGAPDLIAAGPSHMSRAVVTSSALAVAAFSLVVLLAPLVPKAVEKVVEIPTIDLGPLPLIPDIQKTLPEPRARSRGEPDAGYFEPVKEQAKPADPIAPKQTYSLCCDGNETGDPHPTTIIAPAGDEPLPGRDDFVYMDELPVPVHEVKPEYPRFARDAGVEGVVRVHVMVGKDGRVLKAEVNPRFSIPLLNDAALEAARRWTFQPAFVNNHPVVVWVALPFRFRINE